MRSALLALALAVPARAGRWQSLAAETGATEADLGIRAERFETPLTLPAVERLLDAPADGFDDAVGWGDRLSSAPALSGPLEVARDLLGGKPGEPVGEPEGISSCVELPPSAGVFIHALNRALRHARIAAEQAGSVYTEPERARLLASFGGLARHEPLAAVTREDVSLASRFKAAEVVEASRALAARVEAELPRLVSMATAAPAGRWRCGDVLVGGSGDDVYTQEDLRSAAVIVDLGGNNRYEGAAAAAGAGEMKLVVDLGREDVFMSTGASAGAGVFGIGLLYAPVPGLKKVEGGDVSLGAGLFGAGGALLAGPVTARAGHFAEGAAAFGAGVFAVSGDSSSAVADYASQGFGGTRGAGLFVSRGNGLTADCGLRHPDPREGQAMISLCQGVGEGPRAYAAGGVGLALVDGSSSSLRGSYFAQGAGYWHAFGALYVRGDGAFAQARRYSQGAGVHAGAGLLSWRGSDGRAVNWGVGPAFGWDYGVGMLSLRGDRNGLRADWASGEGDVNGRSLAEISGRDNRLRLPDWGLATYKRAAAGYALSRIFGQGTKLWASGLSSRKGPDPKREFSAPIGAWGAPRLEDGAGLAADVDVATAAWPVVDRGADSQGDAQADARALAQADALPADQRPARWLAVAARESLDSRAAASAAARLLSLSRQDARYVVRAMSVEAFDEALWARLAAAAAGPEAAQEAAAELPREKGLRRALLAGVLGYGGAKAAVPAALTLMKDKDWRLRRSGAALLGASLGVDGGEEPGRLRFLEQSLELAQSTQAVGSKGEQAEASALGVKRLFDLYAALSLDPDLLARDKLDLLFASGSPFDPVPGPALLLYARLLRKRADVYAPAFRTELVRAGALVEGARRALTAALEDRDADVRAGAAAALGQLGDSRDAAPLAALLRDPSACARGGAAAGLARLGAAARPALRKALKDKDASVRRLAVLAAAQSGDRAVVALMRRGFSDRDASVRAAAAAALSAVQAPYAEAARKAAVPALDRQASDDADPTAAAAAARQLGRLGRD